MFSLFFRRQKKLAEDDKNSPGKANGPRRDPMAIPPGATPSGVMVYGDLSDPTTGTDVISQDGELNFDNEEFYLIKYLALRKCISPTFKMAAGLAIFTIVESCTYDPSQLSLV